jgi:hypothetical protein
MMSSMNTLELLKRKFKYYFSGIYILCLDRPHNLGQENKHPTIMGKIIGLEPWPLTWKVNILAAHQPCPLFKQEQQKQNVI